VLATSDETAVVPPAQPSVRRRVLLLAGPVIGENLLQTMIGIVDTLFVSRLGANALLAVVLFAVLDRFKRAVLGNATRADEVQARILAHALPPTDAGEPNASLVDLIQADLADGKIACGSQTTRRTEALRVCFQPFEGRVWVCGPNGLRAVPRARRSAG